MVDVFKNFEYAISYEQTNLDLDMTYFLSALHAANMFKFSPGSKVLDIGCGTGESLRALINSVPNVQIVGVDSSEDFLKIAKYKFGKTTDPNHVIKAVQAHEYPQILNEYSNVKNLETHLQDVRAQSQLHDDRISFINSDAETFTAPGLYDGAIANQFIHWPRKQGPDGVEKEQNVLKNIANHLNDGAQFIFTTSNADYRFDDDAINAMHILQHPFYKAFQENLSRALDRELPSEHVYTFDNETMQEALSKGGFKLTDQTYSHQVRSSQQLLEVCLIGGHMQVFNKLGIESSYKERRDLLEGTLKQTLKLYDPDAKPVVETIAYFRATK